MNPKVLTLNPQVSGVNPKVSYINPRVFAVYPRVYIPRHLSTHAIQLELTRNIKKDPQKLSIAFEDLYI